MLDYERELSEMRKNYNEKPLGNIMLSRPSWLTESDGLSALYREKSFLLSHGVLCYAHIVQANVILFRRFPPSDCPANLIFSTEESVCRNPLVLKEAAHNLFSYKDMNLADVPERWRDMARVITDEHDRSCFYFYITDDNNNNLKIYFNANMIHRKLLPGGVLKGGLLPVLALPERCTSVVILPKKYWTESFKEAWLNGDI